MIGYFLPWNFKLHVSVFPMLLVFSRLLYLLCVCVCVCVCVCACECVNVVICGQRFPAKKVGRSWGGWQRRNAWKGWARQLRALCWRRMQSQWWKEMRRRLTTGWSERKNIIFRFYLHLRQHLCCKWFTFLRHNSGSSRASTCKADEAAWRMEKGCHPELRERDSCKFIAAVESNVLGVSDAGETLCFSPVCVCV